MDKRVVLAEQIIEACKRSGLNSDACSNALSIASTLLPYEWPKDAPQEPEAGHGNEQV